MLENTVIKVKKLLYKSLGLLLIFFLVVISLSFFRSIAQVKQTDLLLKNEEQEVQRLREEQEKLEERLKKVQSEDFMEKQLRDTLGLAKEGEIVIVLPDESIVRKFAPKIQEEEEILPDPIWKKWLNLFL